MAESIKFHCIFYWCFVYVLVSFAWFAIVTSMGVCREHAKIRLASFLETGEREMVQSDVVRHVWEYIRVNQLTVGPAPALIKAEVPWLARRGTLSNKDRVLKTVKGILNKLTPEKFDLLKGQLIELKSFHLQFRHFRYIKLCGACPCCNYIALFSATVGLPNYGAHYDKAVFGIVGVPIKLLGSSNAGNVSQDLSTNQWTYKELLQLDSEDAYPILIYGSGALVALWLASAVVGAVDSIPVVPKVLELVGLSYTIWLSSRYLIFKKNREELFDKIEELKRDVLGQSDD